jgi:catechol 2,3-dioxygenase-like lactoylglutathione lyase family enzyme
MAGGSGNSAHLSFVFITVDNMARSLTFYEHLGFKFPNEAFGDIHYEIELPNGIRVFWNQTDAVRQYAPDYRPSEHGRVGFGFQFDTPDEVDAMFYKLRSLGYRCDRTPWDAPWGQRYAIVYDPDGNLVDLCSPNPYFDDVPSVPSSPA